MVNFNHKREWCLKYTVCQNGIPVYFHGTIWAN
jgi:hypothetical protein